ncbi:MAG: single-stranded-DNA-specific exonuclease RecJ [Caldicoprobacterales bacterium]|jgi:single-stranded-DNA-specific exonuclease
MSIYEISTPVLKNRSTITMLLMIELGISEITADLLVNRGVTGLDEARAFLNPSLDQLHDPFLLQGMDQAVNRIRQAVTTGEKIVLYGDYDADGITSSAVLSLYLKSLGAEVDVYIPSRQDEGYGLHMDSLLTIQQQGASLVITVDCGISALEEVRQVQQFMDIIITDHHTPGPELPEAYAVINPKNPGQSYPFQELAGVGVAAKLVQALGGLEAVRPYLDLAAIGTVADIVPLMDENRVFAALGIQQLNEKPRPGISALLQVLGRNGKAVDAGMISYTIGPCLNAPGRMTTFHAGYNLLTAASLQQALPLAEELAEQNQLRKETESQILDSALEAVDQQVDLAYDRVIVVAGENWHPGVVGIVASRITERFYRPAIVLSLDGDEAVGSARSIRKFHLYEALAACKDLLIKFGGHEMAAGLSIHKSNIDAFRRKICAHAEEVLEEEALVPRYFYDGKLHHEQISPNLLNEIDMLAPFGIGNPAPKFYLPSAVVESNRLIGRESSHIKLALSLGQRSWDAIGFGMAEDGKDLQQGSRVSLLTSLKRNEWMGVSSTQFQIHSIKRAYQDAKDVEQLLSCFYFKFFDVFFHDFMYNGNDVPSTVSEKSVLSMEISEKQEILTVENVVEILTGSMIGTAVFVSTFDCAAALLNKLMEENLLEQIPIQYHHPNPGNGLGRNMVILIPNWQGSPQRYYHTVMTPAEEEPFHSVRHHFGTGRQQRKHYQFTLGNGVEDKEVNDTALTLSRDQLGILYKWLRRIAPGRNIWPNGQHLLMDLTEGTGMSWNGFQLRLALEIFKELDFISVESGNQCIRIHCNPNPASRQLDESRLVTYHREWTARHGIS